MNLSAFESGFEIGKELVSGRKREEVHA